MARLTRNKFESLRRDLSVLTAMTTRKFPRTETMTRTPRSSARSHTVAGSSIPETRRPNHPLHTASSPPLRPSVTSSIKEIIASLLGQCSPPPASLCGDGGHFQRKLSRANVEPLKIMFMW